MKHVLDLYAAAFRAHGDSPHAVLWPKGRQDVRFDALTRHMPREGRFSVLDYGCGLAHLKPFLDARYPDVVYAGVDALDAFIDADREKFPGTEFHRVQSPADVKGEYDYVVSSGVFNVLYVPDPSEHRAIVFAMLEQLFARARVYLSVNLMTDAVDFIQPGSYHQNVSDVYEFASSSLSRRLVLDQSYMPYEFTLTVWKDQSIRRPENLYGEP